MYMSNYKSQYHTRLPTASVPLSYKFKFSMTLLELNHLWNSSQNLGEHLCFLVYCVLKDIMKATHGQLGEEINRVRSRQVLSLWSWGGPPSQHTDVLTSPETPQTLNYWGFYAGFTISSPSPLQGLRGRTESLTRPLMVFLVTSPHPGAHPESPSNKRCSCHSGNYKSLRSSVSGTQAKD